MNQSADIIKSEPPHAARFIVTIYGDIAEPRSGELWMGSLIELCGAVGISESLVRTAVSRLVSAEQLVGQRKGRRTLRFRVRAVSGGGQEAAE